MEPATPPPSAYVVAQTGPGSAFTAGSPTNDPAIDASPKPNKPTKAARPGKPTVPGAAPEPAALDDASASTAAPASPVTPAAQEPRAAAGPLAYPTYAATDYRPRGIVEKDLCARASSPDYAYMIGTFGFAAAAVVFDSEVAQSWSKPSTRIASSGVVGFAWGGFLSGAYLSLPKCSPDFVPPVGPEGAVTARWPLAVALSLISGVSAPFLVYIETGYVPSEWAMSERGARIYVPALSGIAGSLLPWIPALAPKTYRNMLKLERLRIEGAPVPPGGRGAAQGAMIGYSLSF